MSTKSKKKCSRLGTFLRVLAQLVLLIFCIGIFVGAGFGITFGTGWFDGPECKMTRLLLPLSLSGLGVVMYSIIVAVMQPRIFCSK